MQFRLGLCRGIMHMKVLKALEKQWIRTVLSGDTIFTIFHVSTLQHKSLYLFKFYNYKMLTESATYYIILKLSFLIVLT